MKKSIFVLLLLVAFAFGSREAAAQCTGAVGALRYTGKISFGTVNVGSSATLQIVLGNVNTDTPLLVKAITSLDSQYTIDPPKPYPFCIQPGQAVQAQVTFTPTHSGQSDTKIRINSSDPSSPAFIFVYGAGAGSGSPKFSISPTSLDFGVVQQGQKKTALFTISNQGTAAGVISQVTSSSTAFSILTAFPKSIPVGGHADVTVQFLPPGAVSYAGTLSVKTGASVVGTVSVKGTGSRANPDLLLSATEIDFGSLAVGTFAERSFGIQNKGQSDLQVKFLPAVQTTLTPSGPLTIGPGKSVQVKIRWIGDATGPLTKTLKIDSNDPDTPHAAITLRASGFIGKIGLLNVTTRSHIGNNSNHTTGAMWVDYNGDGKEDLFLTGHDGNLLFKNIGGGQFVNVTMQSKLGNMGKDCRGASWGDVDNDGDPDLFIANFNGPSMVLKNNKGVFANAGGALGLFAADDTPAATSGIWLDFNNDGRLDLFVVKDGKPNQLFKQTGLFQFADVASTAGVALNGPGVSAVAADFNGDGFTDLYVVNNNHPNKLYINNKNETFRDATQSAGVGFNGDSKQALVSDYDGDGDLDLFVVNGDGTSVLYRNTGNLKFQNATGPAGLAAPKSATAATFADFDNDGDQDLLILQDSGDNVLFVNNGKGKFSRSSNVDITEPTTGSTTTTGDTNNDGTPDVAAGNPTGAPDTLYQNTGGGGNNWLEIVLQGTVSNRSAIGAKVLLRTGVIVQAKVVSGGNGQSQDSLPLEFGLGSATTATVIIGWPSGKIQSLENVNANQKLKVMEPVN